MARQSGTIGRIANVTLQLNRGTLECYVSTNADQKTGGYAERVFMRRPKFVFVTRFQIPAESMLLRRPEHEVWSDFSSNRVRFATVRVCVNPFGANAKHELLCLRDCPRLLE